MIGIVDIGIANLRSVANAVYSLGYDPVWVRRARELGGVTHCILPGVGSFRNAMDRLDEADLREGMVDFALTGKPLLGICLGMQLLASHGEEGGAARGLGLIAGAVIRLARPSSRRVPHVGWNSFIGTKPHPCLVGVRSQADFYFVHSYEFRPQDEENVLGTTKYGAEFVSGVTKNNILGLQFHPEKSQKNGLKILENFCEWDGLL